MVRKLEVTSEDMVEMMLLPRKAAQLPTLRMLSNSSETHLTGGMGMATTKKTSKQDALDSTLPALSSTRNSAAFSALESPLSRSLKASAAVNKKTHQLNKLFETKREEVDRGPLWQLVETAKALAYAKSHPKHEHRDVKIAPPTDSAKSAGKPKDVKPRPKSRIKSAGAK